MREKIQDKLLVCSLILMSFLPSVTHAAGLVLCGGNGEPMCNLSFAFGLVNGLIQKIIFLMLPLAAIIFAYIGWQLMSSGGSEESRSNAKKILKNMVIGLILILCAYLIIKTILTALVAGSVPFFTN